MKPVRLLFCLSLVLLWQNGLSATNAANDWPQFRGPTGQGISRATNVPIHWSAQSNIAWKIAVPGEGWSSPVLSAEKIYLTTAMQNDVAGNTSLRALCISTRDGKILWNVEVFQPDARSLQQHHQKNGLASPTPIIDGKRIYVHFGHMGTAALDTGGKVLWRQNELKYPPLHGNGGSPVLVDSQLVFNCDGLKDPFVASLDANTGKVRWKTPRNTPASRKFSFATPLVIEVNGKTQVISPGSGFVGGYDPKDGREIWRARYGEGYSVIPRPVFAHGLLFVSSGYDRPIFYAINPIKAEGDVTASAITWTHNKGAPNTPSPIVVGDEVYFVSDAGIASCLDARTGKVHWSERLGGGFSASPVAAEGRIYFQNETGIGYVVKAGTNYELLAINELGPRTLASPAIVDNTIYVRSQNDLWRIGK